MKPQNRQHWNDHSKSKKINKCGYKDNYKWFFQDLGPLLSLYNFLYTKILMKQIIFYLLFCIGSFSYAYDSYQTFRAKPLSLNLDFKYYKTEANFNADGRRESLLDGNSYQYISLTPHLRYQLNTDFALIGGFKYTAAESNDFLYTRKSSHINQVDLAAEYLFINDLWMRMFGRFSYGHNLKKVKTGTDEVLTSDGAHLVHPELVFNFDLSEGLYSFAQGGILYRTEGLSTLGTYGLGSEFRFSDFGIGASLLGAFSIKNDEYTDQASYRDNYNNLSNAGSKHFNSVNPNIHQLEINFNFLMSKQSLFKFVTGFEVLGSNTSAGFYLGAHVNWVFDYMPQRTQPRKNVDQQEPIFKPNTSDGVDQRIFKKLEKPEDPVNDEDINIKTKKKNNPEYKLKLKKKKRKQ